MSGASELEPCPHCKGTAKVFRQSGVTGRVCRSRYYRERVECTKCGASTREHKAPGKAIAAWNRRYPSAELSRLSSAHSEAVELTASRAEVVALREALEPFRDAFVQIREAGDIDLDDPLSDLLPLGHDNLDGDLVHIMHLRKAAAALAGEKPVGAGVTEPVTRPETCATDGCRCRADIRFERGGVGSYYCLPCYLRIQALPAALSKSGEKP